MRDIPTLGAPSPARALLTDYLAAGRHAAQVGDGADAKSLFARAVALDPNDASLLNHVARHLADAGEWEVACAYLESAIALEPAQLEWHLNLSIHLLRAGEPRRAFTVLAAAENLGRRSPRYWSARANVMLRLDAPLAANFCFDQAAGMAPDNRRYRHGLARTALETGKPEAVCLYRELAADLKDAEALLGLAQALDMSGDHDEAMHILERVVQKFPLCHDALRLLADLKWSAGRADFLHHFADATKQSGCTFDVWKLWARLAARSGQILEAARIANRGYSANGAIDFLRLEADYLGEAGEVDRAARIFDCLEPDIELGDLPYIRHCFRSGAVERAEDRLGSLLARQPDNVEAWAMIDLAWRLSGDPRHGWLHGQPGLIGVFDNAVSNARLRETRCWLEALHDRSRSPLGQSLVGGTQTLGSLINRHEPIAAELKERCETAMLSYLSGLPADDSHPLLRHRSRRFATTGSWSVRLSRGEHHADHIHPNGMISAVLYVTVPPEASDESRHLGWLRIGSPPSHLATGLQPIATFAPAEGRLILFPSTLYHGTMPFSSGTRTTVAFDIHLL